MDIRQLTSFHRVATLLSFTRAAAELKYAQSSVTAQIKTLEVSLGVELFERLRGRIRLTQAGERLMPYAEQILSLTDEARAATSGTGEPTGVITVGTMESITSYRMPPLLEFFHHRYPQLQIVLRPSAGTELCQALRQGTVDMGFLMDARTERPGVHCEVLGVEELTVVASPEHPLARTGGITTEDLRRVPVLAPEAGCGYRELFDAELNTGSGEPVSFLEFGNIESVKRGVAVGLGVSLLPTMAVTDELAAGTLTALDWTPPFEVHTQLAWRQGKQLSQEMRLFVEQTAQFTAEYYRTLVAA
ncbi:LysR family transcriptional regulator [Streptomyces sp. NPDC005438]|uniref:LysR family transcriptional regulator n=1 Tax=Streptomyces sp. NPDC005438 TaxID=3156880 RepID=UPI0033A30B6A